MRRRSAKRRYTEDIRMGLTRNSIQWLVKCGYVVLACLLLFTAQRVFGQVDEGTITGVVQDQTGAVVPGAQVTLLNTDVGLAMQATTSGAGIYTFSPVRIGNYHVTVAAKGFETT